MKRAFNFVLDALIFVSLLIACFFMLILAPFFPKPPPPKD